MKTVTKILLLALLPAMAHADFSCPTGSYQNWKAQSNAGSGDLTGWVGRVYPSQSDAQAAVHAAHPSGQFCTDQSYHNAGQVTYTQDTLSSTSFVQFSYTCVNTTPITPGISTIHGGSLLLAATCTGTPVKRCTNDKESFSGTVGGKPLDSVCENSCSYSLTSPGGSGGRLVQIGLTIGSSSSWNAQYLGDSTACATDTGNTGGGTAGTVITTNHAIQLNPGTNCGTVDGQYVCTGAVPDGSCITTSTGYGVCAVSITDGATTTTPTPPGPDTGTPGSRAVPIGTVQIDDATGKVTVTNFYSPSQMTGSTVGAPTGAVSNSTGTGAPGTTGDNGPSPVQCGGAGMPACNNTPPCGVPGEDSCNHLSGGEDCTSPPVCDGDPVLCSSNFQAWRVQCGTQADMDVGITAGIQAENSGSSDLLNSANGTVVDVGSMYTAQTPSTGTLQDIVINMGGWAGTVTVPMSQWSDFLHWIGILVLISANLVGIRIVMTG